MDTIKNMLDKYGRPLLAKYVQRGVTYGCAAISAKLAIDAPASDTQAKLVEWLVAGALAGLGMIIDYLHHKYDKQPVAQS